MSGAARALVLLVLLAAGRVPAQQAPVFSAETEGVEVDVRVTRGDQPVLSLAAADFEVRDNGRRQQVELVSAGQAPAHALLLLDRSSSMAGEPIAQVQAATRAFLGALEPRDRVTLLAFDHRLRLLAGPAASAEDALPRVATLVAGGGTALADALYAALKLADPRSGRPLVLALSDGRDQLSWLAPERVLEAARESSATLYALEAERPQPRLTRRFEKGPDLNDRTRVHAADEQPGLLARVARETGGRTWRAAGPELARAFLDVLADARSRYVLRYAPSDGSPGWHALEVRVRGGLSARTRAGYTRRAPRLAYSP